MLRGNATAGYFLRLWALKDVGDYKCMLTHMLPERCAKRSATALSTPAACTCGVLISDLLCGDESADERWQALLADMMMPR